jgi:hypothetical protein
LVFAGCSSPWAISGLAGGSHTFAVRAIDRDGRSDPTPATFVWMVDTTPPDLTLVAAQTSIWPPNGQMVPDRMTGIVTDGLSGVDPRSVVFRVTDSQGAIQPTGPVVIDANGRFAFTVTFEASRRGEDLNGRRYTVTVTALDNAGNLVSATVVITVPHDKGK